MATFTPSVLRTRVVAIALPVFVGACAAADATTPLVPSTLNAALADVAHPALDWASGFFSGAGLITPAIVPTRCPFDAASQFFVCAPLTGGGLVLNQRFTLLDAGGGKQAAFDETTTGSLHLENTVAGTWSSDTIDGQQVLDLTGLGSTHHTLNGTSFTLRTSQAPGPQIPSERRTTISDLVLPVVAPGAPQSWPLSGTIDTRSASIDANGNPYDVFIATMQFDGSSVVKLTLTVPGGVQTCRVNLATLPPGTMGCMGSPDPPIGNEALSGVKSAFR